MHYGGSALVLFLLFRFLSGRRIWQTLETLPVHLWIFVLTGYLATHCIGVTKWRLMVSVAGSGMKWIQAARCYFAGLFGSLFLPSLIGGDLVRASMAMRIGRSKAGVLLGSLVDRSVDLVALGLLAGAGALLVPGSLDSRDRRIFLALAGIGLFGIAVAAAIAVFLPAHRFSYRMRRRFVRVRIAARSMTTTSGRGIHGAHPRSIGADSIHCFEYGSSRGVRIAPGISNMVVCVALGKAFGGNSAHPGRNRFARSGACCSASAVWSACGSIGRGRNCLGGHRDRRRPCCRAYFIPDDAIQFLAGECETSTQKRNPRNGRIPSRGL